MKKMRKDERKRKEKKEKSAPDQGAQKGVEKSGV